MPKYIDADALREEAERILDWNTNEEYCMYSDTIDMIDNAPVLDVVPVVRCKYCRYYQPSLETCDYVSHYDLSPDDFCSNGETRDEETGEKNG